MLRSHASSRGVSKHGGKGLLASGGWFSSSGPGSARSLFERPLAGLHQFGVAGVLANHFQEPRPHGVVGDLMGQTLGLVGLEFIVLGLAHWTPRIFRRFW